MSIDSMRVGGGRCPPLLVGGLLVACLMLVCNWWTLSSENLELVRQIDELNEQLKISAEERDQCVTLRGDLEQGYKRKEDEVASLHVRLEQQIELKKRIEELEYSVTMYKTELDSLNKLDISKNATIDALHLDKEKIITELDRTKDENTQLQEELSKIKDELDRLKYSLNTPKEKHVQSPASTKVETSTTNEADEEEIMQMGNMKNDPIGSVDQTADQNDADALQYPETTNPPSTGSQKPEDAQM